MAVRPCESSKMGDRNAQLTWYESTLQTREACQDDTRPLLGYLVKIAQARGIDSHLLQVHHPHEPDALPRLIIDFGSVALQSYEEGKGVLRHSHCETG